MEKANYLAENISFLCEREGLSPHKLADKVDIDPSTLYRLMDTSNRPRARLRTLKTLADFFRVDTSDLRSVDLRTQTSLGASAQSVLFDFGSAGTTVRQRRKTIPRIKIHDPSVFSAASVRQVLPELTDDHTKTDPLGFSIVSWSDAPSELQADDLVSFVVTGSAMAPEYQDGDIVYVNGFEQCVWNIGFEIHENDTILALLDDNGKKAVAIRNVVKDEFSNLWAVAVGASWAGKSWPIIEVLGKVVAVLRIKK